MKEYHNRESYDIKLPEAINDKSIHELKCKVITPDMARELDKISKKEDISMADKVIDQMVILFGNDKKYYEKFDVFVMNDILTDFTKDVILKKNNLNKTTTESE